MIGLIVGLHFLPMARALHDDFLVVHAVAISLVAALSLLLPEPARSALLGCGIAAILFGTIGCRVALSLARAAPVPPA
ncbi:hypothetical protein [Nguyenibacter sp. L1]|uniref:hypothetical protein n=1 Tax=Nguyenibacter sp. L1 TaxID=3049350 RepID=UPI002B465D89|nr:hypothetical protein [Nguyenibacter sp. L1]WRH89457.1 hypothetical protein QN315_07665 [Nguyenibacter sp. L1]